MWIEGPEYDHVKHRVEVVPRCRLAEDPKQKQALMLESIGQALPSTSQGSHMTAQWQGICNPTVLKQSGRPGCIRFLP